ncbi:MAG: 30S ribosomal protein S20 [Candidatus Schekmanbacteria bacterium GWA2_38_11]|uniref:Small ribosomal subunit protein bS20 n=1 Tax=Candidatus Schekmanbacteria bacterium GWA2_38_11 TaxID=1817876 RepID=A0A1F7RAD6_9BACT|nr:MAG: 30S ribosomal protein S20 [Candidatus Schekmanbacteria bacterium GWA2_38_11]
MAKTKSAEKRIRQSEKRRERNIIVKSQVKTTVKKLLLAVESRNLEKSKVSLGKAISVIDKAAAKGVIHKNTASRKISRLTKKVNTLSEEAA